MSDIAPASLSDPDGSGPPVVDHPVVAAAVERLRDLDAVPLVDHHDRFVAVHDVLHGVLHDEPATG